MSPASKPLTTAGRPYSPGRKAKASAPVMAATCPGQSRPSTAKSGAAASARSTGSVRLSRQRTEKFRISSSAAASRQAAVPGAVVSNPTPRKTTSAAGSARAASSASMGE